MACLALELSLSGERATEGETLSPGALEEGGVPVRGEENPEVLSPEEGGQKF